MTHLLTTRAVAFVLLTSVLVASGIYGFYWLPHDVSNAAELAQWDGRNVRLMATFDRSNKYCDLLHFDDVKIPVRHTPGAFAWPATGDAVIVVGLLQRRLDPVIHSEFVIVNADWTIRRDD